MTLQPWRNLADDAALLDDLGRLLRAIRARIVGHLHQAGLSYEQSGMEAGVSRQRAQQWADQHEEGTR